MKILIPCDTDANGIGGGLSFLRNIKKGLEQAKHRVVSSGEADICLVPAPTMIIRETFYDIKKRMPIVLRIDGVPEDWRNRGTGTPRLKEFTKDANVVIYQSDFIKDTLGALLGRKGGVIRNGVDYSIFKPTGSQAPLPKGDPRILHIMWRQDPNKRPEEVIQAYREYYLMNKKSLLVLVGRYPKGWSDYKFGLFKDEKHIHIGSARDEDLAEIMRACDIMWYPSWGDPAPNVVSEVIACGLQVELVSDYGGVKEIVKQGMPNSIKVMAEEYVTVFEMLLRKGVKVEA